MAASKCFSFEWPIYEIKTCDGEKCIVIQSLITGIVHPSILKGTKCSWCIYIHDRKEVSIFWRFINLGTNCLFRQSIVVNKEKDHASYSNVFLYNHMSASESK